MSYTPVEISTSITNKSYSGTSQAQSTNGQWRGQNVSLAGSDKSLLASATEEMTFLRSEKRSTEISKRKIGDRSQLNSQTLEQAKSYLEKIQKTEQDKPFKPFMEQLLNEPKVDKNSIRQLAGQGFSDISQQYLALVYTREQLLKRKAGNKQKPDKHDVTDNLLAAVDGALDALVNEHSAAINAGINVSEVAATMLESPAGNRLGSLNTLRQFYRDAVLDYGSITNTFQKIIADYGEEHYSDSVSYLVSALGADLASEGPSLPKERLQMIIEDLYKLQSLESLDDECQNFLAQLKRIYNSHNLPKKVQLIEQLLTLLEKKWLGVDQLSNVTKALHISPDMTIYFWQGFKELVRQLPLKVHKDSFERDKLINIIQDGLDQCIEDEELEDIFYEDCHDAKQQDYQS